VPENEGAVIYMGVWDASTNTPSLSDGTGVKGHYYVVSVGGTQNLGSGPITFAPGDWVIHNGTIWQKADHTDVVTSVFGRQGAVTALAGDYAASQITDDSLWPGPYIDSTLSSLFAHRARHISGGPDAFLSTDLLEAIVKRIQEAGGPTTLQVGTVNANELLYRVGAAIVSISPASVVSGNPPQAHKDTHKSGGTDAFTGTDVLEAAVKRLEEQGGPTILAYGTINDGQYLARSGANVVGVTPPIFGQNEQRNAQEAIASVTGTTAWSTLHTWTTGTLPAGTYKVQWSHDWSYSVINRDVLRRVQVNGTTVSGPHELTLSTPYPTSWEDSAGFYFITLGAPGTLTINIDVQPSNAGDTAYIQFSRLQVYRVA
jgi:hypothetical protein